MVFTIPRSRYRSIGAVELITDVIEDANTRISDAFRDGREKWVEGHDRIPDQ